MKQARGAATRAALLLALSVGAGPAPALEPRDLGIVYNLHSEQSTALAEHYAARRGVPAEQVVGIPLEARQRMLPAAVFEPLRAALFERLPRHVQALALVWDMPYRVDCMSVTSAFALGFDESYCALGCRPTAASPYFGSTSRRPFDEHGVRPAMLLEAGSVETTRALIERGIRADFSRPRGTAYLVVTGDQRRNTRIPRFAVTARLFRDRFPVRLFQGEALVGRPDVMFYFIGAKEVAHIETNTFLDGAVADHLTSAGGVLGGAAQMDVLAWLRAGATASYGTVVEPCNFPQKFPDPAILIGQYLNGDSVVEAYWKSVRWPGQGLFVGEPLARPWAAPPR